MFTWSVFAYVVKSNLINNTSVTTKNSWAQNKCSYLFILNKCIIYYSQKGL